MKGFKEEVEKQVKKFSENEVMKRLNSSESIAIEEYHNLLLMIFHQTYKGPATFALAAAHINDKHQEIKSYLLHHAEEEKDHWKWVLDDLKNTGCSINPVTSFPPISCQAYIAFNHYIAVYHPSSRLAIAAVLESIGGTYGAKTAEKAMNKLNLTEDQLNFFVGHGDTDVIHIQEIFEILDRADLTEAEIQHMCYTAKVTGDLYSRMYNNVNEERIS